VRIEDDVSATTFSDMSNEIWRVRFLRNALSCQAAIVQELFNYLCNLDSTTGRAGARRRDQAPAQVDESLALLFNFAIDLIKLQLSGH
jgi:hypothetical protein